MRTAIDCLPVATRQAMLDGVRTKAIVVGAYTDGRGGICPMLAAHRNGARSDALSFARAWDGFARTKTVRRATARELRVLEDQLVASLTAEEPGGDLAAAIAEHKAAVERRRAREPEIVARRLKPSIGGRLLRGRRAGVSAADPAGPPVAAGEAARTAS